MSQTKKMHYVPATYLRKFASQVDGEYRIHILHKNRFLNPVGRPVALNNICAENYLYSIAKPGEKNDAAVEELFSNIFDKEYNKIYETLIDEKYNRMTVLDLYSVVAWSASMFLRNRQVKNYLLEGYEETFSEKYVQAVQEGKPVFTYRNHEITIGGKSLDELKKIILPWNKPFLNSVALPHITETANKWLETCIVSLVSLQTEAEFITSDIPVTTEWSRNVNGELNGGHIRCIPLDSKHLLKISPNHERKDPLILHRIRIAPEYQNNYVLARNQLQLKLCSLYMLGNYNSLTRFQEQMKPILQTI